MIIDKVPRLRIGQQSQNSKGYFRRQKWTHPAVSSSTGVHAAITLAAGTSTVTTAITNPDFPRIVSITPTKAGGAAITGNVVITGTDIRGTAITDTIACSTDTTTVAGVKAFATVTSIALPARQSAGDTIAIGTGAKLGLDRVVEGDECILGTVDGTYEATRPVITSGATVAANIISFNTTLANTKVFVADYVATEITTSSATTA